MKVLESCEGNHYIVRLYDESSCNDEYGVYTYSVVWVTNIPNVKEYKPYVSNEGEYHEKEFDNLQEAQSFYWQISDELLFEEDPDLRIDEEACDKLLEMIFNSQ